MGKLNFGLRKRTWLLVTLLAILVILAVICRDWLAAIPNAQARKCLARRDEQRALAWLRFSRRLSDRNPETDFLLARVHRRQGETDLVHEHLLRAADLGWPLEDVNREQWLALAQSGQMQAAGPHLPELLQDPRGDAVEICEAYVIGYTKMHHLGAAARLLDVWIRDFPNDPQAHFLRGVLHRDARLFDKAERDLRRALEVDRGHHAAALSLAEVLYEHKKTEQALAFFRRAEQGADEKTAALIGQARCLQALSRPDEARGLLEDVLASSETNADALVALARLEIEEGNYQAVIDRLEPAAEREVRNREVRFVLGTALRRCGRNEEALAHFKYCEEAADQIDLAARLKPQVSERPRDPDLRYQIGKKYLDYGFPKDGLIWLESALQCDPRHKATHVALADYYGSKVGEGRKYVELAERHRRLAEK